MPEDIRAANDAGELDAVIRDLAPLASDCVAARFETGPCAEQVLVTADAAPRSGNVPILMRMERLAGGMELSSDEAARLFEIQESFARTMINAGFNQEALDFLQYAQASGTLAFGERAFELATCITIALCCSTRQDGIRKRRRNIAKRSRSSSPPQNAARRRSRAAIPGSRSCWRSGRVAEAERMLRSALALTEEADGSAQTLGAILINLGANLYAQG